MFVGRKEWPVANTKTKKEKTKKAPKIGNFQHFEKQKIAFFSHVPRSPQPKYLVPRSKTVTCSCTTDTHTDRQTDRESKH